MKLSSLGDAKLSASIGAILILGGIFAPSSRLIESLRGTPVAPDLWEQLLLGAMLLKGGLVALGLLVIILGRMSMWTSNGSAARRLPEPGYQAGVAILAVILVSAAALRLYKLDVGLWYDEIVIYIKYMSMTFGQILSTYNSESQHFLFTLLARAFFALFGESAWSLRLPAALFGIGSIWALYALGCRVGSRREGLLSAALLAFSYHHIWFSQNARGYTALLFWTILASWLLLRALAEGRPQLWLLYAISAALGVYSHVTMLFVIGGHFIIYLTTFLPWHMGTPPRRWVGFFVGFGLAGFFTVLLHALVLPQILGTVGQHSNVIVWKQPLWTLLEVVRGMQLSFAGSIVAVVAVAVFGAGLWSFAKTNPVVIQLLFIPAVLGTMVVLAMNHPLWPRFFFFTVGFGVLVVIRGTTMLGQATARLLHMAPTTAKLMGIALCVGLIVVSAMAIPRAYEPKQDYVGALRFVEAHRQPGDAIVTVGLTTFPYQSFYKVDWQVAETVQELDTIRTQAKRTWVLYTIPLHLQYEYPALMASIQRDFKVVKRFYGSLGGGTIFVCRTETSPLSSTTAAQDGSVRESSRDEYAKRE